MIHVRKVKPEFFEALGDGSKSFELRREEPGSPRFAVGDYLAVNEFDPGRHAPQDELYTGRCMMFRIVYVLRDFDGLKDGYVILGLKPTAMIAAGY